jgi:1-acyl-sn-glycerol-3-phosphate acyltransferase
MIGSIFERKGKLMSFIAINWSKIILKVGKINFNINGLKNIDLRKNYFFVPNHESALDIPLVFASIPMHVVSVAKIELSRIPFFGWSMIAGGHFFVDRSNHKKAMRSIEKARISMNKNPRSVFLFPEGTRSLDGKVGRFKKGGLKLAIDLGVPIVPIGIVGTNQFQSNLKKGLNIGNIELNIGKPIQTKKIKKKELLSFVEELRKKVILLKAKDVSK